MWVEVGLGLANKPSNILTYTFTSLFKSIKVFCISYDCLNNPGLEAGIKEGLQFGRGYAPANKKGEKKYLINCLTFL